MKIASRYYTIDGDAVTREQISAYCAERRAVIVWQRGEWKNIGSLLACADAEEAAIEAERDTRGEPRPYSPGGPLPGCWRGRD